MSKASRKRKRAERRAKQKVEAATAAAPVVPSVPALPEGGHSGHPDPAAPAALSGFEGVTTSPIRGYIYFPDLDTRTEANAYTRTELLRRARWLVANVGFARRCVNGAARLIVGRGLMPIPLTADEAWNAEALERFRNGTKAAGVFDVSGKYDWCRAQLAIMRNVIRDGDVFPVLTSHPESQRSRVAIYEAHQIGSGMIRGKDAANWFDGVRVDAMNRALFYRVLAPDGGRRDLRAGDVAPVMNDERIGAKRGVSCLHHAANHLVDMAEVVGMLKHGVKVANEVGFVIESEGSQNRPAGLSFSTPRKSTVQDGDGDDRPIEIADIYESGGKVGKLDEGQKFRLVESAKPSPNTIEFLDWLARDISWGLGLSPDLLWNIAALGGANTRFILDDAQCFVEEWQSLLVGAFLSRFFIFFIAREMKYRGLREPAGNLEWWRHGWSLPPRRTVDFGRDGKLHIQQNEAGMRTLRRHYGELGLDWEEEVRQDALERVTRATAIRDAAEAVGMTPEEVASLTSGKTAAPPPIAPRRDEAEEDAAEAEEAFAL